MPDTPIHATTASPNVNHELCPGKNRHNTAANAARPMAPNAAPSASSAAASRPRLRPSCPISRFLFTSCCSISVTPAGKIAGKARKSPPITGPQRRAISPAATVTAPPRTNRTRCSRRFVCLIAEKLASILMRSPQQQNPAQAKRYSQPHRHQDKRRRHRRSAITHQGPAHQIRVHAEGSRTQHHRPRLYRRILLTVPRYRHPHRRQRD